MERADRLKTIICIVSLLSVLCAGFFIAKTRFSEEVTKNTLSFTSLTFLFFVFPISVIGYYLVGKKIKNLFLVLVSLWFYSFEEPVMVWLLVISIIVNYLLSLVLSKEWNISVAKKILVWLMLAWNFGLLFYYKYFLFFLSTINLTFGTSLELPNIVQPLGISFFTFRMVSFCLDVYYGIVPRQKNLINVALYVSFYPQLVMGPISKYNDFSKQLGNRTFKSEQLFCGVKRVIIGLFKKVVIADSLGGVVDLIFSMQSDRTVLIAWVGIVGYLVQLYYDFAGYSDIAIGIGNLFGFETPENFNYPYTSKSVTEYWSRWHITLGTWLKNYIYTPVFRTCQDSNFKKNTCDILALICVWFFAGIWHGAGWNYLLYGIYYCVFIIIERQIDNYKKRKRKKLGIKKKAETLSEKVRAHVYFIVVLIFGQMIFRSPDMSSFSNYFLDLFGLNGNALSNSAAVFYFKQIRWALITGIVFCFPVVPILKAKISNKKWEIVCEVLSPFFYGLLLIMSMAFAFTSYYQAFVYFQF